MRINILTFLVNISITLNSLVTHPQICFGHTLTSLNQNSLKSKLTLESNSIRAVVTPTTTDSSKFLKRVFLSNRTITCNDGSQAGFYLRKSSSSKKWIVFLEGGWHCYDLKSCRNRWLKLRHLMTSSQWPETRDAGGILSPSPGSNPFWHDANHVLVPYCSSDSWSGSKIQPDINNGWRFMGSLIIHQIIADLIPLGLGRNSGSELLLVGSSAGALGVMINLDKIKTFLHKEKKLKVLVRGVSDSGWFLDREPYTSGAIAASDAVRQGWKMWEGVLPETCLSQHVTEPWKCYFAHRLYPTLKSPLFIFQWLFDEAQMRADSVGAPVTPQQWNYIHEMGGALRSSLDNVTAVFAPSCIGHAVLSKNDWINVKIDNISLADALRCWENSTKKRRNTTLTLKIKNNGKSRKENYKRRNLKPKKNKNQISSKDLDNENEKRHHINRAKGIIKLEENIAENEKKSKSVRQTATSRLVNVQNQRRHRHQTKLQNHRKSIIGEQQNTATSKKERKHCSLRLLEKCSWPQCNYSCPTLTNPLTGEEMRFIELLTSFGLDIEAVAAALGVDMLTLNNMDQAELVNLLTQQA